MMRWTIYLCGIALLSSCGGGGGGSSPAPIPNRAPVITDPGTLSVREGVSNVVSLSGTDADGNSLSFSILSGDDQSLFYQTRNEAQQDVMNYITMWYNSHRLHSYLGYKSPNQFEFEMQMPRLELKKAS